MAQEQPAADAGHTGQQGEQGRPDRRMRLTQVAGHQHAGKQRHGHQGHAGAIHAQPLVLPLGRVARYVAQCQHGNDQAYGHVHEEQRRASRRR